MPLSGAAEITRRGESELSSQFVAAQDLGLKRMGRPKKIPRDHRELWKRGGLIYLAGTMLAKADRWKSFMNWLHEPFIRVALPIIITAVATWYQSAR